MNWKTIWNWQPDCVEDPANGGIYVGNWLSWGFISPVRPATCRQIDQRQNCQRDQRFQRTWLPDDSQPTASRYAVLWPCHRDNVVIAHGWRKRNWRTKEIEIPKETWNFEKEMNLAWIMLHNWNWFRIDELYMLIFYKWWFT